ncbi:hypothetical protein V8E54_000839 [Elaphomyces granulatus]
MSSICNFNFANGRVIPEIDSPERIALPLEYWNAGQEQEFLAHRYFFCVGTLCIRSAKALLSIKAVQALVKPIFSIPELTCTVATSVSELLVLRTSNPNDSTYDTLTDRERKKS